MRRNGHFRDDFYYRLCSDVIVVPPLRRRIEEEPRELEALAESILRRLIGEAGVPFSRLVCDVINRDLGKGYPGRAIARTGTGDSPHHNYPALQRRPGHRTLDQLEQLLAGIDSGTMDAEALLAEYCTLLYRRHGTYEEVARRTKLDRRTVKKYVQLVIGSHSG